jgi:hypothetical protein
VVREMSRSSLFLSLFVPGLLVCGPALSQTRAVEGLPDFSGSWTRVSEHHAELFEAVPGFEGPGPILPDLRYPGGTVPGHTLPRIAALDNPILKPATLTRLQEITEAELMGIPHVKDEGMCQPSGVPMLWNRTHAALQILQTPDHVIIINARDHQYRIVYLDAPHSDDPRHGWYGESVGHYEGGDTLVVDTIGQNDKTQIDRFGTPHSDRVHVVERIRISPERGGLDVEFIVEDPIAFNMPWSGLARHVQRSIEWDEEICAENNRFVGKVSIDGAITEQVPIPTDDTPDF